MVDDLCPTKGGDMLRMVGDPWTIVCLSIKVIAQLRLIYNDEIHFCFYIDTGEVFETMTAASKKYPGISRQSISHNCAGRTKKAGGFRWEYVKDE